MSKSIPSELKKCIEVHRLLLESQDQNGHRAVLTGFDLSDIDLQGVKLEGTHLLGADMTRIQLRAADLTGADLVSCCLEHAKLQWANFAGANKSEASLARAHLQFTNFSGAILESDGFENVYLICQTPFQQINFYLQSPIFLQTITASFLCIILYRYWPSNRNTKFLYFVVKKVRVVGKIAIVRELCNCIMHTQIFNNLPELEL